MADLLETTAAVDVNNDWVSGIYQLEQEDLVLGGADGIDNLHAKQLIARINYVKAALLGLGVSNFIRTLLDDIDAAAARATLGAVTQADINTAIANLVASSPAALDTLKELATALGNDPNFATTMTNALAAKAPLASPALTGTPTAPTAVAGTNTTQLATTAFVRAAIAALSSTLAGLTDTNIAALADKHVLQYDNATAKWVNRTLAAAGIAALASPALTGTPTAPTAAGGTNTTQLATTAFVATALANLVASSPAALDTLNELAAALGNDPNFATTMTNALAAKAPLASPALTGTPTAPTAAGGTNTTQLATTAFVQSEIGNLPSDVVAWVNFNGTGTVAIRASKNVSSITDNGVGDYKVNFTTAMPDAKYSPVFGAKGMGAAPDYNIKVGVYSLAEMLASSLRIVVGRDGVGTSDSDVVSVAVFR